MSHLGPPTAPSRTASARAAGGEHLVGQRDAVGVDRGAAEDVLLDVDLGDRGQHAEPRRRHLRPDAVTRQRHDPRHRSGTVSAAGACAGLSARRTRQAEVRSGGAAQRLDRRPEGDAVRLDRGVERRHGGTSVSRAAPSTLIAVARAAWQAAAFTTGLGQAAATSPFCVPSVLSSVASAVSTVATSGPKAFSSVSQAASTCVLAAVSLGGSTSLCADTHSALATG